jgi:hypothetical protein
MRRANGGLPKSIVGYCLGDASRWSGLLLIASSGYIIPDWGLFSTGYSN